VGLPLALLFAVVVRMPFWAEALRTPVDGDTAIVGLMARHLGRGSTLWGQPYGSPLDAWVAAPLVWAMGGGPEPLRLTYFLFGLALVPVAWGLARSIDPRAAAPAAFVAAAPPPYFLLLSAMPPPLYPTTLLLCGTLLILAVRLGPRLSDTPAPRGALLAWGALAGLALWTHLMAASIVLACGTYFVLRSRRRRLLVFAVVPLLAVSAAAWTRLLGDRQAAAVVSVSSRRSTFAAHLQQVLPRLHRPLGGVLGTHVPVVADDPDHVVFSPPWVSAGLALVYGFAVVAAMRRTKERPESALLLGAAVLALAAFPFPVRSGPESIRFLTPLHLPLACLAVLGGAASGVRRAWVVALALSSLHLVGSTRLLDAWRSADRADPPFLLPDLAPVRRVLDQKGIRAAYASYGPAHRLTYESHERIVASQPWNERFLHFPLPFLDEVRFAKNVAWVLTPGIPTDLPNPREFEAALAEAGGGWRRTEAGAALVYHAFAPPFPPTVRPLLAGEAAGDANLDTVSLPAPTAATTVTLVPPVALSAVTLVAGPGGPRLPRSMDVEVSADGTAFETVARRRRRGERRDLRWVNGHPQYVIDHDLIAVPLAGRTVAAVRVVPVASGDPWALAEVLLHPAGVPALPWDEWLPPGLTWADRLQALRADPRRDREDWYYRLLLASRHR